MDLLSLGLTFIIILAVSIIISSLPLYIAVLLMGGDATIMKVFFVNLILLVIDIIIGLVFPLAAIGMVIVTVIAYMIAFELGIFKAIFAMILQAVVAIALVYIALLVFGVAAPALT